MIVNRVYQTGDTFRLVSKPFIGITGIASYTEQLTGSTGSWLSKEFRYSVDGVNFSGLIALSAPNLTTIVFTVGQLVVFEFVYTRSSGSNRTVTSVTLSETLGTLNWDKTYYDQSNYKQYFSQVDSEVLDWTVNVLHYLLD
jgi:hypothetical protein